MNKIKFIKKCENTRVIYENCYRMLKNCFCVKIETVWVQNSVKFGFPIALKGLVLIEIRFQMASSASFLDVQH